ncbi:hypothetical protein [Massilia cavernae]|nr:hypothetical protein [Massilia cavernae]
MPKRLFVMWAPPRSLSTAFVRIVAARADFTILHEPLCDLAACGHYLDKRAGAPAHQVDSAQALFDYVELLRRDGQVFIKDTCEYAYDDVLAGTAYLRDATHVFMLRDPEKVINSHYHINPDLRCAEVGYEHLARVYKLVRAESHNAPLFVDADQLAADPDGTMARFCASAGLAHMPDSLRWEGGHLDVWERTRRWHLDAANSTGIALIERRYATRVDNHELLRDFYRANLPFYEYLKQQAEGRHP